MIYIPYGAEWELALMKLTKKELVDMVRRVCIERDKLEEEKSGTYRSYRKYDD